MHVLQLNQGLKRIKAKSNSLVFGSLYWNVCLSWLNIARPAVHYESVLNNHSEVRKRVERKSSNTSN